MKSMNDFSKLWSRWSSWGLVWGVTGTKLDQEWQSWCDWKCNSVLVGLRFKLSLVPWWEWISTRGIKSDLILVWLDRNSILVLVEIQFLGMGLNWIQSHWDQNGFSILGSLKGTVSETTQMWVRWEQPVLWDQRDKPMWINPSIFDSTISLLKMPRP